MAINSYTPPPNKVLENLMGIVKTLGDLGVIDTPANQKEKAQTSQLAASTEADTLKIKQAKDQEQAYGDPNSMESQSKRQGLIDLINKRPDIFPEQGKPLLQLIQGRQATPEVRAMGPMDEKNTPLPVVTPAQEATPAMNVNQAKLLDEQPLFKMAMADDKNKNAQEIAYLRGQNSQNNSDRKFDQREELAAQRIHSQFQSKITQDQGFRDKAKQYYNLSNAIALARSGKELPVQSADEIQQAIRNNLGIKGTGGVEEREKVYLSNAGWDVNKLQQYLTGNIKSIDINDPFMAHILDLADLERENARQGVMDQVDILSSGNSWIYNQYPKLKQSLDEKIATIGRVYGGTKKESQPKNGSDKQVPHLSDEEVIKQYNLATGKK